MDQRTERLFWNACGASGPFHLKVAGPPGLTPQEHALSQPFAVIGRDPKADVSLDHDAVSRRHVYLQVIAGRVFWYDLGSRLGVSRGGVVGPSGWFSEREPIGVGPCRIHASVSSLEHSAAEPTNPLADRGPSFGPDAVLEFRGRSDGPSRWRIGRTLTLVGRAAECRLKIPDDGISRFHCALVRTPQGPWIVDLLSREGIRVSGARVRAAPLHEGVHLHVGRYRMVVHLVEASSSEAPDTTGGRVPLLDPDQLPALHRRPSAPAAIRVPGAPGELIVESTSRDMVSNAEFERFVGRMEQMQSQMFDQFHQAMMAMFQAFGTLQRDQMTQVREELDRIRALSSELQSLQAGSPSSPPDSSPGDRLSATTSESPALADRGPARSPDSPKRPSAARSEPDVDREYHEVITRRIAELQGERQGRWKRVLDLIKNGSSD